MDDVDHAEPLTYSIHPPRFVVLMGEDDRPPSPLESEPDTPQHFLDDASWDTAPPPPLDLSSIDGVSAGGALKPRMRRMTQSPGGKILLPPSFRSPESGDSARKKAEIMPDKKVAEIFDVDRENPRPSVITRGPPDRLGGRRRSLPSRRGAFADDDSLDKEGKIRKFSGAKKHGRSTSAPSAEDEAARTSIHDTPPAAKERKGRVRLSLRAEKPIGSHRSHRRKVSWESMPDDEMKKFGSPILNGFLSKDTDIDPVTLEAANLAKPPRSPKRNQVANSSGTRVSDGSRREEPSKSSRSSKTKEVMSIKVNKVYKVDSEISEIKKGIEELEALLEAARQAGEEEVAADQDGGHSNDVDSKPVADYTKALEKARKDQSAPDFDKVLEKARKDLSQKHKPSARTVADVLGASNSTGERNSSQSLQKSVRELSATEVNKATASGLLRRAVASFDSEDPRSESSYSTPENSILSAPYFYSDREKQSQDRPKLRDFSHGSKEQRNDSAFSMFPAQAVGSSNREQIGEQQSPISFASSEEAVDSNFPEASYLSQVASSTFAAAADAAGDAGFFSEAAALTFRTAGEAVESLLLGGSQKKSPKIKPLPTNYSSDSSCVSTDTDLTDVMHNLTSKTQERKASSLEEITEESEMNESNRADEFAETKDFGEHIDSDASSASIPPPPPVRRDTDSIRNAVDSARSALESRSTDISMSQEPPNASDEVGGRYGLEKAESRDDSSTSTPPPPPEDDDIDHNDGSSVESYNDGSSDGSSSIPNNLDKISRASVNSAIDENRIRSSPNPATAETASEDSSDRSHPQQVTSLKADPSLIQPNSQGNQGKATTSEGVGQKTFSERATDARQDMYSKNLCSTDQHSNKETASVKSAGSQWRQRKVQMSEKPEQKVLPQRTMNARKDSNEKSLYSSDLYRNQEASSVTSEGSRDQVFSATLGSSRDSQDSKESTSEAPTVSKMTNVQQPISGEKSELEPLGQPSLLGTAHDSSTAMRKIQLGSQQDVRTGTITPANRTPSQEMPSDERRNTRLNLPRTVDEREFPGNKDERLDVILDPTLLDSDEGSEDSHPESRLLGEGSVSTTPRNKEVVQPVTDKHKTTQSIEADIQSKKSYLSAGASATDLSNTSQNIEAEMLSKKSSQSQQSSTRSYLSAGAKSYDSSELDESLAYEAQFIDVGGPEDPYIPTRYLSPEGHPTNRSPPRMGNSSIGGSSICSSEENGELEMVKSLNAVNGVAKGDITLSLLDESAAQTSSDVKGCDKVRCAVWRIRDARKRIKGNVVNALGQSFEPLSPGASKRMRGLPIDVDKANDVGGDRDIRSLQEIAMIHLEHDEFEETIELYETIIFIYTEAMAKGQDDVSQHSTSQNSTTSSYDGQKGVDYTSHIGVALNNIGILHLLNDDYEQALIFFQKASVMLKSSLGDRHMEYVTSLVRLAMCFFAVDNFPESHRLLEEALALAKGKNSNISDIAQIGEILNNLGCLSFMCGNPGTAVKLLQESLDVQFVALSQSLYGLSSQARASISLNVSISRANVGYIKLLMKDTKAAIAGFESALMHQQLILSEVHETVIATMDNLAISCLLQGKKGKALMMLNRILYAQVQAFGPDDRRCALTLNKITMVQNRDQVLIDRIWKVNEGPSGRKSQPSVAHKSPRSPRRGHKKGFSLRHSLRLKKHVSK